MDHSSALAANLASARQRLRLSLADLAQAAAVSKSTLHDIERGAANPRLDTLYAIATTLGLGLADLIAEDEPQIKITRAHEGVTVSGESVAARLMQRIPNAVDVEVYDIIVTEDLQRSQPHRPGTTECLIVHSGTVEVGPSDQLIQLGPGDSAVFPTDRPHTYRSASGQSTGTLLVAGPADQS